MRDLARIQKVVPLYTNPGQMEAIDSIRPEKKGLGVRTQGLLKRCMETDKQAVQHIRWVEKPQQTCKYCSGVKTKNRHGTVH